jgi:hypothetical protein
MNSQSQAIDKLDLNLTIPLSVPFIAKYLLLGKTQADIARISGRSKQAVNDYIKRKKNELLPLLDTTDNLLALKAKSVSSKALTNLDKILDSRLDKKNLIALNAISGTHIEKYRLLSNKATEISQVQAIIENIDTEIETLEADLFPNNEHKTGDNDQDNEDKLPLQQIDNDSD